MELDSGKSEMAYMFLFNIVKETHQIDMYHKYGLAHYMVAAVGFKILREYAINRNPSENVGRQTEACFQGASVRA